MSLAIIILLSFFSQITMAEECVILLHGLGRTEKSMNKMGAALKEEDFRVVNYYYPSRKYKIEILADKFIPDALQKCGDADNINFVTHSLGGILLRQYQENHVIENIKRTVMLGPPNNGSQVIDKLRDFPGFGLIVGKAGLQLGTTDHDLPPRLGSAKNEVGIIAGDRSVNLILSLFLPNPDDGKVSVQNTKLVGMKDHLVVSVSHPFLMRDSDVIHQVIHFINHGEFEKKALQKDAEIPAESVAFPLEILGE
ncbi:MAG: alpha/beta hydrolase [Gammaproteobacteria bacterium]|nr:MAG: alpha/beta hydrolase [Gammaproteobacteria bacterium]